MKGNKGGNDICRFPYTKKIKKQQSVPPKKRKPNKKTNQKTKTTKTKQKPKQDCKNNRKKPSQTTPWSLGRVLPSCKEKHKKIQKSQLLAWSLGISPSKTGFMFSLEISWQACVPKDRYPYHFVAFRGTLVRL